MSASEVWAGVVCVAIVCLVWAFNVHADRQNVHDLNLEIVKTCTYADGSGEGSDQERAQAVKKCADRMRDAL